MACQVARFNAPGLFLWGYLKQKVYATPPNSLLDLQQRITTVCRNINIDTFENVREEFSDRLFHCLGVNGEHFQHLLQ